MTQSQTSASKNDGQTATAAPVRHRNKIAAALMAAQPEQLQQNDKPGHFCDLEKTGNALTGRFRGTVRLANVLAGNFRPA